MLFLLGHVLSFRGAQKLIKNPRSETDRKVPDGNGCAFGSLRNSVCFLLRSKEKGSITLEASLVLPIFLIAVLSLYTFFSAMGFELKMRWHLNQVAKEISWYGGIGDDLIAEKEELNLPVIALSYLASETAVKSLVLKNFDEESLRYVKNHADGLSFLGSFYDTKEKDLILKVSYSYRLPFFSEILNGIPMTITVKHRVWTGKSYQNQDEEEIYVYVTRTGTVYHKSPYCTYINLSLHEVSAFEIENKKNKSGRKYKPCERCTNENIRPMVFFVTDYGERYHTDLNCSSILRDVKRVPLKSVVGLKACSKCGKDE